MARNFSPLWRFALDRAYGDWEGEVYTARLSTRPDPVPGLIYFLEAGEDGPIKIGYTQDGDSVGRRVSMLQTGNPYRLNVLATLPGTHRMEKTLHACFKRTRLQGEWFEREEQIDQLIDWAISESIGWLTNSQMLNDYAPRKTERG